MIYPQDFIHPEDGSLWSVPGNAMFILAFFCLVVVWFYLWYKHKVTLSNMTLATVSGLVLTGGTIVYFIGLSEYRGLGAQGSWLGNILLSFISSCKMFVFDSSLELIEKGRESPGYMTWFSLIHTAAASISIIFVINYFGVRLASMLRRALLCFSFQEIDGLYIFFGVDDHSIALAEDIRQENPEWKKHVIVFVDTTRDDGQKTGIRYLVGNFQYRRELLTQINNVDALWLHNTRVALLPDQSMGKVSYSCSKKPAKYDIPLLGMSRLFNRKSIKNLIFFAMSENEKLNINTMCNIVSTSTVKAKSKFYCHAFRGNSNLEFETSSREDHHFDIRVVDSSYLSAMSLKTMTDKSVDEKVSHLHCPIYKCHPVNFVETEDGLATTDFHAAVIGFGNVGSAVLNFVYEYGQFPYKDRTHPHFVCHVFDKDMTKLKGHFLSNEPGLRPGQHHHLVYDDNSMICYHQMNTSSEKFWLKMEEIISSLNYIVISLGEDEPGIRLATDLYELAIRRRSDAYGHIKNFMIFVKSYHEENEAWAERVFSVCEGLIVPFGQPSKLFRYNLINDKETEEKANQFNIAYQWLYQYMNDTGTRSDMDKVIQLFSLDRNTDKDKINKICRLKKLRSESQNKNNAYHVYTKLKLLGLFQQDTWAREFLGKLPVGKELADSTAPFHIDEFIQKQILDSSTYENLVHVAIGEHMRWNASHLTLGYTPMSLEDFRNLFVIKNQDKLDYLTANDLKKQHVCIRSWDELIQVDEICNGMSRVRNLYECYDVLVVLTSLMMALNRT